MLGYASSSRGDSDLRVALVATAGDPDLLVSADYPNPHCSRNGGVGMTVRYFLDISLSTNSFRIAHSPALYHFHSPTELLHFLVSD